ncbi:hypothetical protein D088_670020 [Salmonella enterica subsp. houtenae serovar 16:z4,z32:-- str. RKS3027]|nr:hypothetical protein D088_670020 [Salmonella enterica subsp. houtenae serovar 16:z4,z32:-- str. RKS3027]
MLKKDESAPLAESTSYLTIFGILLKITRKTMHYNSLI